MREFSRFAANIFLFALSVLFLASVQSSMWFQIFGNIPAPAFWIPVLVYIFLFRRLYEAVPVLYFFCLILSAMTTVSEGMLMLVTLCLGLMIRLMKQRVFWLGHSYFMMVCGIAAFMFHVFHWAASNILEEQGISSPAILSWFITALLTPLISPVLYVVFSWFDTLTDREQPAEVKAQVL